MSAAERPGRARRSVFSSLLLAATALFLVVLLISSTPVRATVVSEYTFPGGRVAQPEDVVVLSPDQTTAYFTERNPADGNRIGQLTFGGTFSESLVPVTAAQPWGLAIFKNSTHFVVAFTEFGLDRIAFLTCTGTSWCGSPALFWEGSLPDTALDGPTDIALFTDSDNILGQGSGVPWFFFTERLTGRIGVIAMPTSTRNVLREWTLPGGTTSAPWGIAIDSEGKTGSLVWFAENAVGKIGALDPTTGRIREFLIPTFLAGAGPVEIAIDPEGFVWFTERTAGASGMIGRLAPWSGSIVEYPVPPELGRPWGIAIDAKTRQVWFSADNGVGMLDPASRVFVSYFLGSGILGRGIAVARDAGGGNLNVWFAEQGTNRMGRIFDVGIYTFTTITTTASPTTSLTTKSTTAVTSSTPSATNTAGSTVTSTAATITSGASLTTAKTFTDTVYSIQSTPAIVSTSTNTQLTQTAVTFTSTSTSYISTTSYTTTTTQVLTSYTDTTSVTSTASITTTFTSSQYTATVLSTTTVASTVLTTETVATTRVTTFVTTTTTTTTVTTGVLAMGLSLFALGALTVHGIQRSVRTRRKEK